MGHQSLDILVKTIDEQVLEFPMAVTFDCEKIRVIGMSIVRVFDIGYCINVLEIFKFRYGSNVFGTQDFKSIDEFSVFVQSQCSGCPECCELTLDGCLITINGNVLTYGEM